jgi:hypothetical protein
MGTSKSQRTILSEDGELRSVDAETEGETTSPDARLSAVFCCNCGTANQARSQFCRTCGQSLDEQVLSAASLDQYTPPESKNKRFIDLIEQAGQRTPEDKAATREGSVLFFLAILAAVSIAAHEIWLALLILLMFAVIVVFRRWVSSGH